MIKKITINFSISIFLFFSSFNILKTSIIFLFENISIRESFYLPNIYLDIDNDGTDDFVHKGIREGGSRYNDIFNNNIKMLKKLNFTQINNLYLRIKKIDINNTDYKTESEFISKLKLLAKEKHSFKKETAIYIPKNVNFFWNMSCDKHAVPFIATSITNLAMIFGLPEDDKRSCYGKDRDYGFNQLYLKQTPPLNYNLKNISSDNLCIEAINKNFKRIIEINLNSKNDIMFINHDCSKINN